jgi:hypothetical protein
MSSAFGMQTTKQHRLQVVCRTARVPCKLHYDCEHLLTRCPAVHIACYARTRGPQGDQRQRDGLMMADLY